MVYHNPLASIKKLLHNFGIRIGFLHQSKLLVILLTSSLGSLPKSGNWMYAVRTHPFSSAI